jgi:predicted lactoylglutathione lyase
MEQRVSLITLGVRDVSRAQAFYEALGWRLGGGVDDETDHVAFFQLNALVIALWDRGKLADDSGVTDGGGWGGVTLAYNVRSPEEVDAVLTEAQEAGATIPRAGAATFWGGYSGVFIDPDGHPWEVAHNPAWTVHEDGRTTLHGLA